jgi:16S rRNA (guanine527-N7)-methyltransferase
VEKLVSFGILLAEASASVNLTRILDPEKMAVSHFLDTSHLLPLLKHPKGPILDIGCGGGIPGLPLAVLRRDLKVVMIDGTGKKIAFLKEWIRELEIRNAEAVHARAEEHLKHFTYPVAVLRAAVKPVKMMEILLATGPSLGTLLFMEGEKGPERARSIKARAKKAGYVLDTILPYRLPGLDKERHIVSFKRITDRHE